MENKYLLVSIVFVFIVLWGFLFVLNANRQTAPATILPSPSPSPTPIPLMVTQNPTPTPVTELRIEEIDIGTGQEAQSGDTITVHYTGMLTDGKKFDSSVDRNQPFTTQIGVGKVIKGWDSGMPGMKVGGKRRLTIPPDLGYGSQGVPEVDQNNRPIPGRYVIPPNSVLIFDVELISVQ